MIPKRYTIGGIPYGVKTEKKLSGGKLLGDYTDSLAQIRLSEEATLEIREMVFWHEVIHQMLARAGLNNYIDKTAAEALCDGLGAQLADLTLSGQLVWSEECLKG